MSTSQSRKQYLRKRRRRKKLIRRCGLAVSAVAIVGAIILVGNSITGSHSSDSKKKDNKESTGNVAVVTETETEEPESETESESESKVVLGADDYVFHEQAIDDGQHYAIQTPESVDVSGEEDLGSKYAILINADTNKILAYKDAYSEAVPASMTKVLTVLVASEQIPEDQLSEETSIDYTVTDYCLANDCSSAGLIPGEPVPVSDLFYCTILPSGADGAVGLAQYVAGTQDDFVTLMNQKLEEMDLSSTAHFTNCIGIYNEDHYCTVYDMAMIMEAALEDPWVKEVLSTHKYTTTATETNTSGLSLENLFLTRTEDAEIPGTILAAKTGYVDQSGNCAVSAMTADDGTLYICVTIGADGPWNCIYDHEYLYSNYTE